MSQESSSISGGMLVVLGILVAAGLGFFFFQNYGNSSNPSETNISVTTPDNGLGDAAPAAGSNDSGASSSEPAAAPATSNQ